MSVRRCATEGCAGTLPAGTGTHCPRCGGTNFIRPPRRRGRWVLLILLLIFVAVLAIGLLSTTKRTATQSNVSSAERQALVDARDLAAKMTMADARDNAYTDIIHRALAQRDFEYACQLGGEMTMPAAKDKCLLEIVEEALKAHQPAWATRAADEIVTATTRDEALRKIMDAGAGK